MKKTFSFSIRKKLLLLSVAVLSLPYVGYQYVREMEHYLREGLEISLTGTASSVSGLLSGQEELFPQAGYGAARTIPLFVHPMKQVVQIDGYSEEWDAWLEWAENRSSMEGTLSAKIVFSERAGYLYALFLIKDDALIYQRPDKPFDNESDQIEIFIEDNENNRHHYWIAPSAPGQISAYEQGMIWNEDIWEEEPVPRSVTNITGAWQGSKNGYILELKIPARMVGQSLGVIISDVDNKTTRQLKGTINTLTDERPNQLVRASSEIGAVIEKLDITEGRRVWVLDTAGHVLASYGDLKHKTRSQPLNRLYSWILPSAVSRFKDDLAGASRLQGSDVSAALAGKTGIRWRSSPDGNAAIVTSAQPIRSGHDLIGVVVAEETTGNIQTVQRKAMADLFTKSLLVFVAVTLLLLLFASNLSSRIRRLRREADEAIDEHGRVMHTTVGKPWRDELGDLSLHYSEMLERLKQYNDYLESLAGKLSHELRTPMAVVQSSLESLDSANLAEDDKIYVDRAKNGVNRLQTLVTRLSEAARLEGALQASEIELIPVNDIFSGCVEGYRAAYPQQSFQYEFDASSELKIFCAPDLVVQMLDKLVSNAVDFSKHDRPIKINISEHKRMTVVKIINYGPPLPEKLEEQLFDSMISVRNSDDKEEPHLGLGLYIARLIVEFHKGELHADNLSTGDGAVFTVKLPSYG